MSKWKYFTDEETKGCVDDLCFKMDRARELFGEPIIATCWLRDAEHNAAIGGVPGSAHVTGQAVDMIAPADSFRREKLAWALGRAGFSRVESAPGHFHADVDASKPTPCFFGGGDH